MKILVVILACAVSYATCFGGAQDKTDWGQRFNSEGATLALKETGKTSVNGQTMITYRMFATGLPKEMDYTLWTRPVGSGPQSIADAFISRDGLIVNVLADPSHGIAEDPIDLKVLAGRGEPKRFAVISNDAHYRVFAEVVPFPIENSAGPCKLSATMMLPDYFMVQMIATGLQSKEELQVESQSGNEGGQSKAIASDDGSYRTTVLPFVKGQTSGKLKFSVKGNACSLAVEVPWGKGSYVVQ